MIAFVPLNEFGLGAFHVQVWGLSVALGFLAALYIWLRAAKEMHIDRDLIWDLALIGLVGMIVGGRLGSYLLVGTGGGEILTAPGGFSLLGGAALTGAVAFAYLYHRRQNIGQILDALTPGIVLALLFVRVGCFLVGDHVGKLTALPWALLYIDGSARQPVALYHILFLAVIFLFVLHLQKKTRRDGRLFFLFCAAYAGASFLADLSRCDDLPICDVHLFGLTVTQWIFAACLFSVPYLYAKMFPAQRGA
jgi:phosphatidylglycerol:prolipoprotein diacylglycerol transferase